MKTSAQNRPGFRIPAPLAMLTNRTRGPQRAQGMVERIAVAGDQLTSTDHSRRKSLIRLSVQGAARFYLPPFFS
jgi:hypothetical protein